MYIYIYIYIYIDKSHSGKKVAFCIKSILLKNP